MTLNGHIKTGAAMAFVWYALAPTYINLSTDMMIITSLLVLIGSLAPDFTEFGVIPHRTFTHYWPLYTLLGGLGYYSINPELTPALINNLLLPEAIGAGLLAFCIGAINHIVMDIPFYGGVPVIRPMRKVKTLNLTFDGGYNNALENTVTFLLIASPLAIL